jgi:hypothetical protein
MYLIISKWLGSCSPKAQKRNQYREQRSAHFQMNQLKRLKILDDLWFVADL